MSINIPTQSIFPAELIWEILHYTDPQDIIQWRTASLQIDGCSFHTEHIGFSLLGVKVVSCSHM